MTIQETNLKDCYIIEPTVFGDERGCFFESFNQRTFEKETGLSANFVQDNRSKSSFGVLRGLHLQLGEFAQAKLVSVLSGEVLDVAVDLREQSPTYGQHIAVKLSGENKKQMFIPRGFAHGFVVLSESAEFFYKCDNFYAPQAESGIIFNDPQLNIDWGLDESKLTISEKDQKLPTLDTYLKTVSQL
ncbi:dTDP-4-dehydrorhamnose 3,5-epimerase [Limibacter armeniacum]|uniref:dTDP-4-dehydrorhamnose 3,5-epimerase n=1 Tax=Limibacter armeniacum TaxID=466084 RepID=UPI002FE52176